MSKMADNQKYEFSEKELQNEFNMNTHVTVFKGTNIVISGKKCTVDEDLVLVVKEVKSLEPLRRAALGSADSSPVSETDYIKLIQEAMYKSQLLLFTHLPSLSALETVKCQRIMMDCFLETIAPKIGDAQKLINDYEKIKPIVL